MSNFTNIVDDRIAEGWRVESRTEGTAVLIKGKPVNHILHVILSVITFGAWILVWINVWAWAGERRTTIRQWDDGKITEKKQLPGPLKSWPSRRRILS